MGSSLPPKEANLFKVIVKSYETKQYKKGLKAADSILKKFPEHGETLSMKGLTLNCMDRKSEAYELVRRGLKNDLKSHVCWHVYGLLYRSDREYREAIKCYRNALRIDPDNIEILRDLSLLQAQMRDLSGFVETRQQLLSLKPNHRMNWIGFAVAHHLNSNSSKAIEVLEAYEGTLEDDYPPDNERYEHSEMLLYKISLFEECEMLDRALEEMQKKESKIVDKLSFKEQMASILFKLGRFDESEKIYRSLLFMNPDNYNALYESLKKDYAWSSAVKRIPLDFLEGEKFQEAADNYVRPLLTKGKVLQHAGNFAAAAALADEARSMDLADRYLNSECVMQMLQADQVGLAEKTAVLFTKDGDQHNNLHDMQCMWYELASGESYYRQGDLGRALKNFLAVEKHYADMSEDQFDFHSYCLRKMTLRAYVSMLKFQDRLHAHEYFHKAAAGAIRCYMKLHDSPAKTSTEENDEMAKLPPAQRKKLRQKQKKAEARAKREAEVKQEDEAATTTSSKSGKKQPAKPVDMDPHGEKLLQIEDPLAEATKYLKLLQHNSSSSLETHLLSFELNMRKQKVLLAFQAVKQLIKLDENDPDSHRCLIKFFHKINTLPAPGTDSEKLICNVLEAERPDIRLQLHGKSLIEVNRSFLEKHSASLTHRAAAAEMMYLLEPDKKMEAIKLIEDSTNNTASGNNARGPVKEWHIQDCIDVHKLLETVFGDKDAANRWKACCAEYFPYSTYFEGIKSVIAAYTVDSSLENSSENGTGPNAELRTKEGDGILNGTVHIVDDMSSLSIR
ncbi:hypothetical protein PR202_ga10496 [Eleusine coracana subsp. coracana]|uniref:Uncharacterized protein n=1 Tax=Eleusine coracana subsp. coracana TaxID=191504 RepID=A0AAV5C701_ELECO|nr:hypothetical protein PR202_ga10496 [Eleusine coracana subsp. coracana]